MTRVILGDIAISQTGPFGSQLHEEDYVSEGTPIVTVEHLGDTNFTHQNLPFVSEADTKRLSKYILIEGDIVFSRVGSIDRNVYVDKNHEGWMFSGRCIRVRADKNKVNPRYLSYYFKQNSFKKMMMNLAVGATMPSLNTKIMNSIELDLLPRENQDKIANILSTIDGKIETNNQINQELEAMAKTLYDYWFVQFDFPDQNGKPYKSLGGKMVYHPELKREIPEGWGVDSLWNIANFYNGLAMQKYRPDTNEDDYLPVIKIREMMNGFSKDTEKARLDIPTEAVVERGDILFSWSATLEVIIWGKERGALNQHIFKVTSDTYPKSFIYFELKSYLKVFKAIAELRKTTMGHITQDHLKQAKIVVPPIEIISKLDAKLQPIMLKQQILENQNQELTHLRDWLLPMLMNEQVKV